VSTPQNHHCADDDQWTPGNPGLTKATRRRGPSTLCLQSPFPRTRTREQGTDFNDLALLLAGKGVSRDYPLMEAIEAAALLATQWPELNRLNQDGNRNPTHRRSTGYNPHGCTRGFDFVKATRSPCHICGIVRAVYGDPGARRC